MSQDPSDSAASADDSISGAETAATSAEGTASDAPSHDGAAASSSTDSVAVDSGGDSNAQADATSANPAPRAKRRFSKRARLIALVTAGAVVVSAGAAGWAIYNKPELRLVRAIKATTAQKNMDLNLSFQATPAFLRAMNEGKPLFDASDAPLPGIKSEIGRAHV